MKPIIFNTAMVRAILSGKKSQTRRVITNKIALEWLNEEQFTPAFVAHPGNNLCPYYDKDDHRLYVRETFFLDEVDGYYYRATAESYEDYDRTEIKWKPSIFLPKVAARIILKVKNVKIERVQDISEDDAEAEGVNKAHISDLGQTWKSYSSAFEILWDSINKRRGYGWDKNPWVWCVEFKLSYQAPSPFKPKTEGEPSEQKN